MPESNVCIVVTTVPDLESAKELARRITGSRLAACAKMIPTESMYWWKGKLEERSEYLVEFTVRAADFESVRMAIMQSHPYELPMVVKYALDDGSPTYFDWVLQSTNVR
jgi:periplasmic divalent cation tolerance protein